MKWFDGMDGDQRCSAWSFLMAAILGSVIAVCTATYHTVHALYPNGVAP